VVLLVLAAGVVASTLFGLDARKQAGIATKNAEDADREKRKAEEKTKEVEEKERIATQARDETELELIRGLLRPVGLMAGELTPAEIDALTTLHGLRSDSARVRFIEEGLRTAETARRLDRRAAWVMQAAAGLDAGRRRQVEEVLMRHLRQREAPAEVRGACVSLGIALEVRDPDFDELAGETIVAATARSIERGDLKALSQRLEAVGARLDTALAGQAADLILAAMGKTTDADALFNLAGALRSVAGRLDAAAAGKLADLILAAMGKATDPNALGYLSWSLGELAGRLDAAAAGKAADAIVAAMGKTTDANTLRRLSGALVAVIDRLDAGRAGKAAEAILAAMSKAAFGGALQSTLPE
jgi:hypothetical protein